MFSLDLVNFILPKASTDSSSRQWALCVYCDLIEFTGPSSVAYQNYFLQFMGQSLLDASPDVRQAAAYGVGVAAKAGGASYSSFCVGMLSLKVNF